MGYRQRRDETAGKKCAEMLASSGEILGKLPEVFPPLTSEFSIKRRILDIGDSAEIMKKEMIVV